ncbi:pyridoxamine 5'-phosphate oxidase family protein [Streptacidiphilus carbonis]|uniref:pyridoxamine 5'-phosphate oxidase family protein n=1 Tax=Streptacidiphilus carbonis TaxID=105422 RepID=UPI0005AB673B|nr:pyridoxamine 5'-phosphate oxidase family protein [Streptacidiphilus carbonis]
MSEEPVRHPITARSQDADAPARPRRTVELNRAQCLRLLGGVSLGRIVFTQHALPAIRPVNHIVVDGDIIVRTHQGAALAAHVQGIPVPGAVVAYEADIIDPDTHLGWSVVATGYARLVTDPAELAQYQGRLQPWVDQAMDHAVRIHPEVITGIQLTA